MASTLAHRGPDDAGVWVDESLGVGFAFRRLAVIDRTATGHQPMVSPDGMHVLVFNGELYNFRRLRTRLEHVWDFRGTSDTEVFLAAVAVWGVVRAVREANGMFAFAVLDLHDRTITLGRDRLGEKPIYVSSNEEVVAFASELRALARVPKLDLDLDRRAMCSFFRYGYVPGPLSIFEGVRKLGPGTLLTLSVDQGRLSDPDPFWSLPRGSIALPCRTESEIERACDEIESLLLDSITMRLEADVPVGAFLSGGIDSSLVVSLMGEAGCTDLRTFTMGFAESGFDESDDARAVAQHLGAQHVEHRVTAADAWELVPGLGTLYDEPFADPAAIPAHLMARIAREDVVVCLSGDGGDELFGGYDRYHWTRGLWRWLRLGPTPLRRRVGGVLQGIEPDSWERAIGGVRRLSRGRLDQRITGAQIHRLGGLMDANSPGALYSRIITHWPRGCSPVLGEEDLPDPLERRLADLGNDGLVRALQIADATHYLPDDILVKVDRATMAVGLEARVPMLDPRLVELAFRLPPARATGKALLKRILDRRVPPRLTERPKHGFSVPIGEWLRGPLREWADDLLDPARLSAEGLLDHELVGRHWIEHRGGDRDWSYRLWDVLMFETWLEAVGSPEVA